MTHVPNSAFIDSHRVAKWLVPVKDVLRAGKHFGPVRRRDAIARDGPSHLGGISNIVSKGVLRIEGKVAFLLALALLVLAPIAISRSPLRLKAALHILPGMVAGLAAGIAVGAPSGSGELAGHLSFLLMFCGGIWVSVRKIRRARSTRP